MRWALALVVALSASVLGCAPCESHDYGTPIVLSFDGRAPKYIPGSSGPYFELGQHDTSLTTDWPTARTPWLARDLDHDGNIGSGAELFGSETLLASGEKARDGFTALADLDDDGDGVLDAHDAAWDELLVWRDLDANRHADRGELKTVRAAGILRIRLAARPSGARSRTAACVDGGDCELGRASFDYVSFHGGVQTGAAIDVDLGFHAVTDPLAWESDTFTPRSTCE